jgi:hypothetical protein
MAFKSIGKTMAELGDDYWTDWIASNRYGVADRGPAEKTLCDNRDEVFVCGMVDDDDASYSYDDWALVRLGSDYYMLSTQGCSCPSPAETWIVEIGPATIPQIKEFIKSGEYSTYSLPADQHDQFMQMLGEYE